MVNPGWPRLLLLMAVCCSVLSVKLQPTTPVNELPDAKYAFVMVYLGGSAELLSLRVLLKSMLDMQYPRIILTLPDITVSTVEELTADGGVVHRMGSITEITLEAEAADVLSKLYLWHLTKYERVIYLSNGNVVVHPGELAKLFKCGHFCAIYQATPCAMDMGILVVKPDEKKFRSLIDKLEKPNALLKIPDYVSRDQYFLSKMFPKAGEARIFNPAKGDSEDSVNRLHFAYGMKGFFYIEKRNWDLFRCGAFKEYDIPAAVINFDLGPWKPWVWWMTTIEPAWVWLEKRSELGDSYLLGFIESLILCVLIPGLLGSFIVAWLLQRWEAAHPSPNQVMTTVALQLGHHAFAGLLAAISLVSSMFLATISFSETVIPVVGWVLFLLYFHAYLMLVGRLLAGVFLGVMKTAKGEVLALSDLYLSVLGVTMIACQPFIDQIVEKAFKWGVHIKVMSLSPGLVIFLGSQYLIYHRLVTLSPIYRNASVGV